MLVNYRVYTKATETSVWRDNGIIESNKVAATEAWASIINRLGYYAFKLEPITFGIAYAR